MLSPPNAADRAAEQVAKADASGKRPVLFVHGLWLLPSSWENWATLFEDSGFAPILAAWPDDPLTVEEAAADPAAFADKTIAQVAESLEATIRELKIKPFVVGHSFGGLLAQILAGRGLSAASVAIDPAPFQGVLALPLSALKAAWPALGNPLNRHRAVALTPEQFRFAFTNAVEEAEAEALYHRYAAPAPGAPLFQAAFANFNPWTEDKVDTKTDARGPLLIVSGERDNTVPPTVAQGAYKLQSRNSGVTEIVEMKGRGHSLTIDSGWREVAETALAFLKRFN
jgi:non-heme chloroperoxidase